MAKLKYQNPNTVDAELDSVLVGTETDGTEIRREIVEIDTEDLLVVLKLILRELSKIKLALHVLVTETGEATVSELEDLSNEEADTEIE